MIKLPAIEHKKYAVLGLGKSGQTTAKALKASGADVYVWDDNEQLRHEVKVSDYKLADFTSLDVSQFEALILSPGIPHTHPTPHPAVLRFKEAKIPIMGDVELLFRACPDATYIGVTGTNGKSTTTALIGHILEEAGLKAQIGGNLGTPVLSFDPLGKDGFYVLEMSSYQLELITHNLFTIAILLNITADHLARHGGMKGYVGAKQRIINDAAPQTLIIGIDETETEGLTKDAAKIKQLKILPLSLKHPAPQGIEIKNDDLFFLGKKVLGLSTLPLLPGKHNAQNIGAAFAACRMIGLEDKKIIEGLQSFPGLPHRQQLVATIKGVRFINDSKATNADAAEKALLCYQDIYWIMGGRPKEGGLQGLEKYKSRIRHAYIIGREASEDFSLWCKTNQISYSLSGTLEKAVKEAAEQAKQDKIEGAVVLLSPACASWDQFESFEERGNQFIANVERLTKGNVCQH